MAGQFTSGTMPQHAKHPFAEFSIPREPPPAALAEDFRLNPHLEPMYQKALGMAIVRALQDPRTRPAILSRDLIVDWVRKCQAVLVVMHRDMGLGLIRCITILGDKFREALLMDQRVEDVVARTQKGNFWAKSAEPQLMRIGEEDIRESLDDDEEKSLSQAAAEAAIDES